MAEWKNVYSTVTIDCDVASLLFSKVKHAEAITHHLLVHEPECDDPDYHRVTEWQSGTAALVNQPIEECE